MPQREASCEAANAWSWGSGQPSPGDPMVSPATMAAAASVLSAPPTGAIPSFPAALATPATPAAASISRLAASANSGRNCSILLTHSPSSVGGGVGVHSSNSTPSARSGRHRSGGGGIGFRRSAECGRIDTAAAGTATRAAAGTATDVWGGVGVQGAPGCVWEAAPVWFGARSAASVGRRH
eukprot:scaffold17826_cov114-Isochrysis_galbana.AAC.7